jgi:hypothetical protein
MTTNNTFRKVSIHMERARAYGHYYIRAFYRGMAIKALTTDAELWDSFTDPECKHHHEAKRSAYQRVVMEYQNVLING